MILILKNTYFSFSVTSELRASSCSCFAFKTGWRLMKECASPMTMLFIPNNSIFKIGTSSITLPIINYMIIQIVSSKILIWCILDLYCFRILNILVKYTVLKILQLYNCKNQQSYKNNKNKQYAYIYTLNIGAATTNRKTKTDHEHSWQQISLLISCNRLWRMLGHAHHFI